MSKLPVLADINTLDDDGRSCAYCVPGTGCLTTMLDDTAYTYTCCSCRRVSLAFYGVPGSCTHCLREIYVKKEYRYIYCRVCGPVKKYSSVCVGVYNTTLLEGDAGFNYEFYCSQEHAAQAGQQREGIGNSVRVGYYEESKGLRLIRSLTYKRDSIPDISPYVDIGDSEEYRYHLLYSLRDTLGVPYPVKQLTLAQYFKDRPECSDILLVLKPVLTPVEQSILLQWLRGITMDDEFSYPKRTFFTQETIILIKEQDAVIFFMPVIEYNRKQWGANVCILHGSGLIFYAKGIGRLKMLRGKELFIQATRKEGKEENVPSLFNPVIPPNNKYIRRGRKEKKKKKTKRTMDKKKKTKRELPSLPSSSSRKKKKKKKIPKPLQEAIDMVSVLNTRIESTSKSRVVLFYFGTAKAIYEKVIRASVKKKVSTVFEYTPGQLDDVGENAKALALAIYESDFRIFIDTWEFNPVAAEFAKDILLISLGVLVQYLKLDTLTKYQAACKSQFLHKTFVSIVDRWSLTLASAKYTINIENGLRETRKTQQRQAGKIIITDHPQYTTKKNEENVKEDKEKEEEEEEEEENTFSSSEEEDGVRYKPIQSVSDPIWKRYVQDSDRKMLLEAQRISEQMVIKHRLKVDEERLCDLQRERRLKAEEDTAHELRVSQDNEKRGLMAREQERQQQRLLRESQTQEIYFNELETEIPNEFDMEFDLGDLRGVN